jgi:hypothetical protein
MAPKKLTEADKVAILGLYRQPEETTSTLAERYGVSNSTISRLLKASLPDSEYKSLIQQKRGTADRETPVAQPAPLPPPAEVETVQPGVSKAPPILKKRDPGSSAPSNVEPQVTSGEDNPTPSHASQSRRRRSRSTDTEVSPAVAPTESDIQLALATDGLEVNTTLAEETAALPATVAPPRPKPAKPVPKAAEPATDEDWTTEAVALDDDYGEEDDDDDDDDGWDGDNSELAPHLETVEIAPLTPSDLPAQCYLVVERVSSELVALPLKTFASLGQIPDDEADLRTLPVFDNHRVARRFSRRNQRVIKVPDGNLLQTTRPYLQAKGITRLLIDGQVFALEDKGEEIAEVNP